MTGKPATFLTTQSREQFDEHLEHLHRRYRDDDRDALLDAMISCLNNDHSTPGWVTR